jgi:hypothetical protein
MVEARGELLKRRWLYVSNASINILAEIMEETKDVAPDVS